MQDNPLTSIIVPVYKVEPYLRRCLDSIVNQTYTNLEIILVDDGSPDNCPAICDEYAKKDSRIVVIHKENGGLSDARNTGLDICKGEWISFVDSDDCIVLNFVETLFNIAKTENSDLVVGNHEKFFFGDVNLDPMTSNNYVVLSQFQALEKLSSEYGLNFTVSWGKLYKKDIWKTLRFPKGKLYEDAYVCHLIYTSASNICFVDAPLYKYLQRKDSIMGQTKNPLHAIEAQISFYNFIRKTNYKQLALNQIQTFFPYLLSSYKQLSNKEQKDLCVQCISNIAEDFNKLSSCDILSYNIDESILCWKIINFVPLIEEKSIKRVFYQISKKMVKGVTLRKKLKFWQLLTLKIAVTFPQLYNFKKNK